LHWLDDTADTKPTFLFSVQSTSGFISDGTYTGSVGSDMQTSSGTEDIYAKIPVGADGTNWLVAGSTALTYSMRTVLSKVNNADGTTAPVEMLGVCMVATTSTGSEVKNIN
jgi:hypothetical protein